MTPFTYEALPMRVRFGSGTIGLLKDELAHLGCRRALVLSTPQQAAQAQTVADRLGVLAAGVFTGATMHTPVAVTEQALTMAREVGADVTIAIGGGSTTGLGKAIALRTDLPQIVVPTTYAGSEMTPILGETAGGRKTTQKSMKVLPEVVIYDVDLTIGLPAALSATSGMNAIAHAVEALYARDRNPVISLMAENGIRAFARALPKIVADPSDADARSDALYGAWLCGMCLGSQGMSLHHKLCHVIGGSFDLPHAETHTVILPHAVAYNTPAEPAVMGRIAAALGVPDAAMGLFELAGRIGAPRALRDLGMREDGIEQAAREATESPYWNPRLVERQPIRELIARAWAGAPPQ